MGLPPIEWKSVLTVFQQSRDMLSPRRSAQLGLLATCTLVLASVALLGWSASIPPHPEGVGQSAPSFTLQDTEGHPFTLPPSDGKIQVLYFWSIRQASCHEANKVMVELYGRLDRDKVRFLSIHAPTPDSADAVAVQAALVGMKFPILMDHNGDVSRQYHVVNLPAVCVIGPTGLVRLIGPVCPFGKDDAKTSPRQIETLVRQLVHESAATTGSTQALANASGQPK